MKSIFALTLISVAAAQFSPPLPLGTRTFDFVGTTAIAVGPLSAQITGSAKGTSFFDGKVAGGDIEASGHEELSMPGVKASVDGSVKGSGTIDLTTGEGKAKGEIDGVLTINGETFVGKAKGTVSIKNNTGFAEGTADGCLIDETGKVNCGKFSGKTPFGLPVGNKTVSGSSTYGSGSTTSTRTSSSAPCTTSGTNMYPGAGSTSFEGAADKVTISVFAFIATGAALFL